MEKPTRNKNKSKTSAIKQKSGKRKSDGPTCSMFLADLTRKLMLKKKQDSNAPLNIVQTIIESITNALPVKLSRKSPPRKDSPMKIETLQTYAPELLPNDTLDIPRPVLIIAEDPPIEESPITKGNLKIPKMPLTNSDVFKPAERKLNIVTEDVACNTGNDKDVAGEIAKYVGTLRRISLIAEEFNQKTAKNLKEIVDSVQEDLIKKLEEIQTDQGIKPESTRNITIEAAIKK